MSGSGFCQACGAELGYKPGDIVGRNHTCPGCNAELHACVQCAHHDPRAANECREPQAERVDDRRKANFCEYFALRRERAAAGGSGGAPTRADAARARLDSLFKKPGG
jgi:hypothetical protein